MSRIMGFVVILGVILGGIAVVHTSDVVNYTQETVNSIEAPKVPEQTDEDKHFAEIMKIKEQEARLEAKRDVQKKELEEKSAEYKTRINELQKEFDTYKTGKESEIKSTEAELASFIKATSLSKKE